MFHLTRVPVVLDAAFLSQAVTRMYARSSVCRQSTMLHNDLCADYEPCQTANDIARHFRPALSAFVEVTAGGLAAIYYTADLGCPDDDLHTDFNCNDDDCSQTELP